MITIIDYGMGNLGSVLNMFKKIRVVSKITSDLEEIKYAKKLLLPGVGSFDWAMNKLNSSGMRGILDELVLEKRVPILGICIGMQKTDSDGLHAPVDQVIRFLFYLI